MLLPCIDRIFPSVLNLEQTRLVCQELSNKTAFIQVTRKGDTNVKGQQGKGEPVQTMVPDKTLNDDPPTRGIGTVSLSKRALKER